MIIDDRRMSDFLDTALPALRRIETATTHCPVCNHPVHFPTIARRDDIDAFRRLLDIAEKYLKDSGAQEKMLAAIMEQIMGKLQ